MKKKILCLTLGLILTFSQVMSVSASERKQQLKEQKAAAQSQLSAENSKIDNLETKKNTLLAEIDQLDQNLVNVLVQIDVLEGELATKETEIAKTQEDLKVAEQNRDKQYEDMKKRIQYLYENGGNDAWAQMLLQADDLASMLNQAEYVQKMYDSDRRSLENFKESVKEVTELGDKLETEKADLEVMQQEYEVQQADLETQLAQKRATSSDYDAQIANAESQAAVLVSLISKQNAEIQKIEEEEKKAAEEAARKAAEEAAKKKAAEEAARKAAEEEAARQQAANANKPSSSTGNSSKPSGGNTTTNNNTNNNASSNNNTNNNTNSNNNNNNNNSSSNNDSGNNAQQGSGSSGNSSSDSTVPYNPTGAAVVNYACQFVGNPYVYGGNSLTNGTDCSGFIKLVYANFGVSLPRSSGAYLSVGRSVPYSQAMPGDIICYSGHVALYMGGGQIVHASNSKPYPQGGIKIGSNAAYKTILSVRRVL